MLEVTCAIIRNEENEVLVVQRGEKTDHPFKWEFPGGKTNENESYEDCIIREISEELSLDIIICCQLSPVEYDYGHKNIRLIPFVCDSLDDLPVLSEHIAFKWVTAAGLADVDLCRADVVVAQQYIGSVSKKTEYVEVETRPEYQESVSDKELQEMINNMMSMKEAEWVANSALENPALFLKLLEFSYSDESRLAFRASWTLSKVCVQYPEIILPHLEEIVIALPKFDNESVVRSFLRIISISDVSELAEKSHGLLADYCFAALSSATSAIAVKAYSMEILYQLSLLYPQLANELSASIMVLLEDGSAGIVSKGNKVLKKITGIPLDR